MAVKANINEDLYVIAAAGSGKTRVIIERALELVLKLQAYGEDASSIAITTFTKAAAQEIKQRLLTRAAEMAADGQVDLFDGVCIENSLSTLAAQIQVGTMHVMTQ